MGCIFLESLPLPRVQTFADINSVPVIPFWEFLLTLRTSLALARECPRPRDADAGLELDVWGPRWQSGLGPQSIAICQAQDCEKSFLWPPCCQPVVY